MRVNKAVTIFMLIVFSASIFIPVGVAFADEDEPGSISTSLEESMSGEELQEEIDGIASGIVDFVRGIAGILGVAFCIWAGFVFWGAGGDPRKMQMAKTMVAGFIICMILVFSAEKIVGGFLSVLGYTG